MASSTNSAVGGSHGAKPPKKTSEKVQQDEGRKSDLEEKYDDRRLWVGNLDPKLTEGYAFITFKSAEDARKCLDGLNGKRILERNISIRYAHQTSYVFTDEEEKLRKKLPALGMKLEAEAPVSKERTINAIEAKLRAMEREKKDQDDFSLTSGGVNKNKAVTTRSSAIHYQYAKASAHHSYDARTRSKPYSRNYPRKRY